MPFFSFIQKDFQKILSTANQISPKRSDIDIFTYTRIEAKKGSTLISSINNSFFFETTIAPQNVDASEESVTFLIKTDLLASSVALISDDKVGIDLDMEKLTLTVTGRASKHTLRINTSKLDDFIRPEQKHDELVACVNVAIDSLADANKLAFSTVGQPKSVYQPEFLSICYTLRPQAKSIAVASSDKYRISRTVVPAEYSNAKEEVIGEEKNFLLNPKSMQLLASVVDPDGSIELKFEQTFLWVVFGDSVATLRYGEGTFPAYEKIIPQSFSCTFMANAKDMNDALKQIYFTARSNAVNKTVSVAVQPGQKRLLLTSKSDDGYSSESTVPIDGYEGMEEGWTQSFNAEYLLDYVGLVHTQNVLFECNPGKPMVMSPENDKVRQLCLVQGLR